MPVRRAKTGFRRSVHPQPHAKNSQISWGSTGPIRLERMLPRCRLERAMGFEPTTPTLARLCSTPELRPRSVPALPERARIRRFTWDDKCPPHPPPGHSHLADFHDFKSCGSTANWIPTLEFDLGGPRTSKSSSTVSLMFPIYGRRMSVTISMRF